MLARLGRYELIHALSAGGMGAVHLARDTASAVEALVAIKVLLPGLGTNSAFVKMFLDEARAVARLRHKNIVQIHDIAEDDGHFYIVMEYIPGQSLRELIGDTTILDRPLFRPRIGADLFAQVASALATVHHADLVHRDVSPNNIMVGDEGIPKLIDFGIARALGTASLTTPGTLKGKFSYMAPEYVQGRAYDHRIDIFSLGVVMWETFARRRLFRGAHAAEQLERLLHAKIPRLDAIVEGIPLALGELVAHMLERDPDRRIAGAGLVADSLHDIAHAQPASDGEPNLRRWLEHRIPARLEQRRRLERTIATSPPSITVDVAEFARDPSSNGRGYDGADVGTSIRLGNGEVFPREATRRPKKRLVMFGAFVVATLAVAGVFVVRTREEPAVSGRAPDASTVPPRLDSPRQRGIEAMANRDYAVALSEFAEALRLGDGDDLLQLMEIARKLQRSASEPPAADAAPRGR